MYLIKIIKGSEGENSEGTCVAGCYTFSKMLKVRNLESGVHDMQKVDCYVQ